MAATGVSGDKSQLPLNGVVLCCTSISAEQRGELTAIAAQMGASTKLDLTGDVTHLIVGDVDTPKYKYVAKERMDVKVLQPSWIPAVRDKWIEGTDDLDLPALELQYRVPTFFGLRICVTGFEDLASRKEIEELAKEHGAKYSGDLTREITHLIAYAPVGAKYMYSRRWGIKIVTKEWFEQSLQRGMILEEALFDPMLPPDQQGQGAWNRRSASSTSLGKRRRGEGSPLNAATAQGRKLRRSASSKFDSQSDGFWTDIVAAGPNAVTPDLISKWDDSLAVDETILEPQQSMTVNSIPNPFEIPLMSVPQRPKGLFSGRIFTLYGFNERESKILERYVSQQEGQLSAVAVSSMTVSALKSSLIIVPHSLASNQLPAFLAGQMNNIVTDFWVEKCLHTKMCVDPASNPAYRPFEYPAKGVDGLVISATAFEGIDLLHLSKTVSLMGAKYDQFLTAKTSILVCNNSSMSRDKIKHALEWSIPAVSSDWLWHSIRRGEVQDLKSYLVYPSAQQHLQLALNQDGSGADGNQTTESATTTKTPSTLGSNENAAQARSAPHPQLDSELKTQGPFYEDDDECGYVPNNEELQQDDQRLSAAQVSEPKPQTQEPPVIKPLPLQERSPNSPTKPKSPLSKKTETLDLAKQQAKDRETLSDTLHTILSRQKSSGSTTSLQRTASLGSAKGSSGRRERRLLGRATSNLSARSGTGPQQLGIYINHSRASSIDTLHTDGLGTPIEGIPMGQLSAESRSNSKDGKSSLTASALTFHDDLLAAEDDEEEQASQKLQLTQVGYQDPEASRWRTRLLRKITAAKDGQDVDAEEDHEPDESLNAEAPRVGILEDTPTIGRTTGGSTRSRRNR